MQISLKNKKGFSELGPQFFFRAGAGTVEYADCTSENEATCWLWVATGKALGWDPGG